MPVFSKLHDHTFIAFEGTIAVGKTTHATLFAESIGSDLLLEQFDQNEFLTDFYCDAERWALPMQLWFLAARQRQLSTIVPSDGRFILADYSPFKDGIFAGVLLRDRELRLYGQLATGLNAGLALPSLIVLLDARNEVLIERIRVRGRTYEQRINAAYLSNLRDAYERELSRIRDLIIVRHDTSDLDLKSAADLKHLHDKIIAAASATSG